MNGYPPVARRPPPHCQSGRSPAPWITTTTGLLPVAPVGKDTNASARPATGSDSKNAVIGATTVGAGGGSPTCEETEGEGNVGSDESVATAALGPGPRPQAKSTVTKARAGRIEGSSRGLAAL